MTKKQKQILSALAALLLGLLGLFGIDLVGEEASQDSDQAASHQTWKDEEGQAEVGALDPNGHYTDKQNVVDFIDNFQQLPDNYLTKEEARNLGWVPSEGNLDEVAPGMSIGGDIFGNFEGNLPEDPGRQYYEADINYEGGFRNAERLVFSDDGLYFYTDDHYDNFEAVQPSQAQEG